MLLYLVIVFFFTLTNSLVVEQRDHESDSNEENFSIELKLMQEMMKKLEDVLKAQNSFGKGLESVEKKIEEETSTVRRLTQQLQESVEKKIDERTTNLELNADVRMESLKNDIELILAKGFADIKLNDDPTDKINEMDGLNTTTSKSNKGVRCNENQNAKEMDLEIYNKKFDNILEKLDMIVYNSTECTVSIHVNDSNPNKDHCKVRWVNASNGDVPPNTIPGDDKNFLYVGRAFHEGDLTPGKIAPSEKSIYIPYGGKEYKYASYQAMTGCNVKWVSSSGSTVIKNAIPAGYTKSGDLLYVCRVEHEGYLVNGKAHLKGGVCYIPYGGREIGYANYYILTKKTCTCF